MEVYFTAVERFEHTVGYYFDLFPEGTAVGLIHSSLPRTYCLQPGLSEGVCFPFLKCRDEDDYSKSLNSVLVLNQHVRVLSLQG